MISLDTETTGIDLRHGARPFFVTTCAEDGGQKWWEWNVDPLTREVEISDLDLVEIAEATTMSGDELVLQIAKFDVAALHATSYRFGTYWPWDKTHDTLIAGHLLASNQPHNLTDMVMHYLGADIEPFEKRLEAAVKEARKIAKRDFPKWRLAGKDVEGMPSAKEKTWKFDTWLPKIVAEMLDYPKPDEGCKHVWQGWVCNKCKGHRWWIVLREYGNADSASTLPLWKVMEARLKQQDLWEIYLEKVKQVQVVFEMERRGVTVLLPALRELRDEYQNDCVEIEERCLLSARSLGHDLVLPKGSANNKSLTAFVFDVLKTPVLKRTPTGLPALDKEVIEEYKKVLAGEPLAFIKDLSGLRKRGKSIEYLESYERHGIKNCVPGIIVLHPSLNPTATATTRFSCENPNLQQVSKGASMCEACLGDGCEACGDTGEDLHSVRGVFGPAPGREWWPADAENIELRIPAFASGQQELIELFERPKDPPFYGSQHLLNFSVVYEDVWREELRKVGPDKVGPHCKKKFAATWYQWCKNGDFALQYQCGEATADRAFHRPGSFRKLKAKFSKLEDLNRRCVAMANKLGYVETLPDKAVNPRRGYPLLCARTERGGVLPTTPLNYMSQGTAGWWMVKAMSRCHEQLKEWRTKGFDGWMILTVHDELVFDFPESKVSPIGDKKMQSNLWRMRIIQNLMAQGGEDIGVPTPVAVEWVEKCWSKGVRV